MLIQEMCIKIDIEINKNMKKWNVKKKNYDNGKCHNSIIYTMFYVTLICLLRKTISLYCYLRPTYLSIL